MTDLRKSTRSLCSAAVIAALYTVLTILSASFSLASGAIQFRISEALCILAVFTPAAIPGLTVGCIVSGLVTGCVPLDIIFGSLATLAGSYGVRLLRRHPYIAPAPYFLANAVAVPLIVRYAYGSPSALPFIFATVALGEIVCAWAGGIALYLVLSRTPVASYLSGTGTTESRKKRR